MIKTNTSSSSSSSSSRTAILFVVTILISCVYRIQAVQLTPAGEAVGTGQTTLPDNIKVSLKTRIRDFERGVGVTPYLDSDDEKEEKNEDEVAVGIRAYNDELMKSVEEAVSDNDDTSEELMPTPQTTTSALALGRTENNLLEMDDATESNPKEQPMVVNVYGMSKCDDFSTYLNMLIPALKRFGHRKSYTQFDFLGRKDSRQPTGFASENGQDEVLGNIYLLCAQHLYRGNPELVMDFLKCSIQDHHTIPLNMKQCAVTHKLKWSALRQCATSATGVKLMSSSVERAVQQGTTWSPSMYVDMAKFCMFRYRPDKRKFCPATTETEIGLALCYIYQGETKPQSCHDLQAEQQRLLEEKKERRRAKKAAKAAAKAAAKRTRKNEDTLQQENHGEQNNQQEVSNEESNTINNINVKHHEEAQHNQGHHQEIQDNEETMRRIARENYEREERERLEAERQEQLETERLERLTRERIEQDRRELENRQAELKRQQVEEENRRLEERRQQQLEQQRLEEEQRIHEQQQLEEKRKQEKAARKAAKKARKAAKKKQEDEQLENFMKLKAEAIKGEEELMQIKQQQQQQQQQQFHQQQAEQQVDQGLMTRSRRRRLKKQAQAAAGQGTPDVLQKMQVAASQAGDEGEQQVVNELINHLRMQQEKIDQLTKQQEMLAKGQVKEAIEKKLQQQQQQHQQEHPFQQQQQQQQQHPFQQQEELDAVAAEMRRKAEKKARKALKAKNRSNQELSFEEQMRQAAAIQKKEQERLAAAHQQQQQQQRGESTDYDVDGWNTLLGQDGQQGQAKKTRKAKKQRQNKRQYDQTSERSSSDDESPKEKKTETELAAIKKQLKIQQKLIKKQMKMQEKMQQQGHQGRRGSRNNEESERSDEEVSDDDTQESSYSEEEPSDLRQFLDMKKFMSTESEPVKQKLLLKAAKRAKMDPREYFIRLMQEEQAREQGRGQVKAKSPSRRGKRSKKRQRQEESSDEESEGEQQQSDEDASESEVSDDDNNEEEMIRQRLLQAQQAQQAQQFQNRRDRKRNRRGRGDRRDRRSREQDILESIIQQSQQQQQQQQRHIGGQEQMYPVIQEDGTIAMMPMRSQEMGDQWNGRESRKKRRRKQGGMW